MLRLWLISSMLAIGLSAAGAARADDLVQRDLAAFLAFSQVRGAAVEDAIQRRDRDDARAQATRLHQEECRFLERIARYLRARRAREAADEVDAYAASYRELPLTETVRMRRQTAGGSHVHAMALDALAGRNIGPAAPATAPAAAPSFKAPPPSRLASRPHVARVLADVNDGTEQRSRRSGPRIEYPSSAAGSAGSSPALPAEDTALASGIRVPKK